MQLTHLGHAAVLVEAAGTRILIDPGNLSDAWHGLADLDVIAITHQHPDHVDPEALPRLVDANPDALLLVEGGVPRTCDLPRMRAIRPGQRLNVGEVEIAVHGGRHASIHADIPGIGNVGLTITAPGEPVFFHPGDCLEVIPEHVDVLAIPIYGPWAAMKETIDFVRAVGAPHGFGVHEGLLNERGWSLISGRLRELTATEPHDLRDREPWRVPQAE